ncbi:MAG: DUF4293 domain-containing protein [Bacteroidales bacterium]|nr:DUF4293 domain-containing protein [Bacteroidales bacterium]MBN2697408.1 DUF4293 domain-containing protein [Bacteroidales bacterium]
MIQRIQTLYLLAAFILSLFLFTGPLSLITTEGNEIFLHHSGAVTRTGEDLGVKTWPLTVYFIVVSALLFFSVFSYRNRIRQMRISVFLMFFAAGMAGIIFYYIRYIKANFGGLENIFQWRIVVPPIILVLLYLAYKAIQRDELVVRAYDRIR